MKNNKLSDLTPEQNRVFDQIIDTMQNKIESFLRSDSTQEQMLSLTGSAGTGKTFLVIHIARYLLDKSTKLDDREAPKYDFVVTAPTHKALSVLEQKFEDQNISAKCKTIHSFLGIKPTINYETGIEEYTIDRSKPDKETTSILIVDESSMVGLKLFKFISEAIHEGRVQLVLFIGDTYQLLPVGDDSNIVCKLRHSFRLNGVVRQAKGDPIIQIATKLKEHIKEKEFPNLAKLMQNYLDRFDNVVFFDTRKQFMQEFYSTKDWHKKDQIIASYTNKAVDSFNSEVRFKYWQQQGIDNPPYLLEGDRLRLKDSYVVNDTIYYYNNQVVTLTKAQKGNFAQLGIEYWECKVDSLDGSTPLLVVDLDSMNLYYESLNAIAQKAKKHGYPSNKKLWEQYHTYKKMFANVQYTYASTIHKLQGSTYEEVYFDLASLLKARHLDDEQRYRLSYVAITRASKLVNILFF